MGSHTHVACMGGIMLTLQAGGAHICGRVLHGVRECQIRIRRQQVVHVLTHEQQRLCCCSPHEALAHFQISIACLAVLALLIQRGVGLGQHVWQKAAQGGF
jgi:hypothetical protein